MKNDPHLKYVSTDNGNCRVYYRNLGALRCFQEDRPGEFVYYACSRDGEPSFCWETQFTLDRLPPDDSPTAMSFRAWAGTRSVLK